MDKMEEIRRQKLVEAINNAQADYYSKPENQTRIAQYQPEIGGYVAPGAGSEMADPIILEELMKEFKSDDDYASEYFKRNK